MPEDDVASMIPVTKMHDAAAIAPITAAARPMRRLVRRIRQTIRLSPRSRRLERELAEWKQLVKDLGEDARRQTHTILQLRARLAQTAHQAPHLGPGTAPARLHHTLHVREQHQESAALRISNEADFYVGSFGVTLLPAPGYVLHPIEMRADLVNIRANAQGRLIDLASNRIIIEAPLTHFGGACEHTFARSSEALFILDFEQWAGHLHYANWWATVWLRGRKIYDTRPLGPAITVKNGIVTAIK